MKHSIDHDFIISTLSQYGDYGEVYEENIKIAYIENDTGRLEKCYEIVDRGYSLRTFLNDNIIFSATNCLKEKELLNNHLKLVKATVKVPIRLTKPAKKNYNFQYEQKLTDSISFINELYNTIKGELPHLINSKITLQRYEKVFFVSGTEGNFICSNSAGERFSVQLTAMLNNEKIHVFESIGGSFSNITIEQMRALIEKAIARVKVMAQAKPAKAGVMPCILSSESGGTLIHEAVGHGLEADLIDKGVSIYGNKLGEKVASNLITVVDDSTYPFGWGSFLCDDEGTDAHKTTLIEKGTLKSFLYDKFYAFKHNTLSTGNGRRQSYANRPFPRMTNTFILPGETPTQDILNSIKEGLLVKKMGGGQVNTLTGDFIFEVQEGYYVENGQIIHPVKQCSIIGNGPKILSEIEAVGDDFGTSLGTCGKEGQGVPVGDGQPTILIPAITIGGSAL